MISTSGAVLRWAAALLLAFVSSEIACEPRALSPAEIEAVRLVSSHLSDGPAAFWNATAASSPLRGLGESEGTKEIEIRVGPREHAEWELVTVSSKAAATDAAFRVTFPSGADDTVLLTMVKEGSVLRLADVRSMSDPVRASAVPPPPPPQPEPRAASVPGDGVALAAFALILFVAAFVVRRRSPRVAMLLGGSAVLAAAVTGTLFYLRHAESAATASPIAAAVMPRGSEEDARRMMVELRRQMAAGGEVPQAAFRRASIHPAWRDRALLWSAQIALQRSDLAAARTALASLRQRDETPLAKVLEGRVAFLEGKDIDAVMAYEKAMELGAERDDLQFETATVLLRLGFDDRAEKYFRRLSEFGSREPGTYYTLAALDVMDSAPEKAEKHLLRAFSMRPDLRSSLIRFGIYYELLRRPLVAGQMSLHRSAEPLVRSPSFGTHPIPIPPGAIARCLAEYLEIDFAGATLRVPGGAAIAPPGTQVVAADDWDRVETKRALGEVSALTKVASQPSSYAQPALARRIEETASALAVHNRWSDLAALTANVNADSALVPVNLLLMKALSMKRTGRDAEARALLESMAARPSTLKRLTAEQLLEAGEMLASVDAYALAIKLMDRAGRLRDLPHLDDRVRQLSLNERIETFSSITTPHFVIRYSAEMPAVNAKIVGDIAEAEFQRLQKWIPIRDFRPVAISIVTWETFRGTYTGTDEILGFYDGKITIPFAHVDIFPPEIVAILSHELAHAMIAQRTNDQAPRWFQEGLAQRIESVRYKRNAFNMYEPDQLLSLAVLDASIAGYDPQVTGQGYLIAHALVRYLESRGGTKAIQQFLDGYADGKTTAETIESFGVPSLAAFDEQFHAWGLGLRDVFTNEDLVTYGTENDAIRIRRGTESGRRKR
jgi:tetratricopeptide (TPR) repeat protein